MKCTLLNFWWLGLLCSHLSWAGSEPFQQQLAGSSIAAGQTLSVTDGRYAEMESGNFTFVNQKVSNQLTLAVSSPEGPTAYTTAVGLKATYEVWDGTRFVSQSKNFTLTVNYDPSATFQDQAVIAWGGGHRMVAEITSVSGPVASVTLTGTVTVERYEALSTAVVSPRAEPVPGRGELSVQWEAVPGAEFYDLEWTYVNNYNQRGGDKAAADIPVRKNAFKHNSTRVSVEALQYAIPLIYDQGYILYRVRPVGRSAADDFQSLVAGNWSFVPADGQTIADVPHKFLYQGHQTNLNWQSTISFAEEGKNKAAVSYFDGSLRNRQVVSRLNSEDKSIVGETIYDYQGRPAVQVLPVPTATSKIGYQRAFNQNVAGRSYSRTDFDQDLADCEVSPEGMSSANGASQYYSPNNPDKVGHQAYLPDAQQYPFTQVEYTPDNTGRIRRQSGVGVSHKLGSGHETQYFYGKPAQEELDRLFGSDAGLATHYKKNMVMDANGQVSVSYLDPQGRVVATALAGATPSSLQSISKPEDELRMRVDLLGKVVPTDKQGQEDRIGLDGQSRRLTQQVLVSQQGGRSFNYDLRTASYKKDNFCYDCVYDLAIRLTDDCGNQKIPTINTNNSASTIGSPALACPEVQGTAFSQSFETTEALAPGTYNLARTLSINRNALDLYTEDFLSRQGEGGLLPFEYFLDRERESIEIFDCEADCESCLDEVGEYSQYSLPGCDPCLTESEYEARLAACDFLCQEDNIQCENALQMLLTDMSPFGQYGAVMEGNQVNEDGSFDLETAGAEIDATAFPLSIFNESNILPNRENPSAPSWRNPYHYKTKATAYYDERGREDKIEILVLPDGTYSPKLVAQAIIPTDLEAGNVFLVNPQELLSEKEFVRYWKPSWAQSLVRYHPEYTYYEHCLQIEESHRFDARWLNTESIENASSRGYLTPLSIDPFFQTDNPRYDQDLKNAVANALNNYLGGLPLTEYVHRLVNCPTVGLNNETACTYCPDDDGITTNVEWNTYKSLYFSLKQRFVEKDMVSHGLDHSSLNQCLGGGNRDLFRHIGYLNLSEFIQLIRQAIGDPTCQSSELYAEKTKRFPLSSDLVDVGQDFDFTTCYSNTEGEEPLARADVNFEVIECTDKMRGILEEAEATADVEFFERCGQCPLAHDLQTLLDGIAQKDGLGAQGFQLSCYPESKYPEWVPDLETAITEGWSGEGKVYWDQISINSLELVATINRRDGTPGCTVRMTATEDINWSAVKNVCCLNYEPNPEAYAFQPDKNFAFMASIAGNEKKVRVEGIIECLTISGCTLPPVCELSPEATDIKTLLNTLVFDFSVGEENPDLASGAEVSLTDEPYQPLLAGTFTTVPTTVRTWEGVAKGNLLDGVFRASGSNGNVTEYMIQLTKQSGYDFGDILGFTNIRPDKDHPEGPENHFIMVARVQTELGEVSVAIPGYSSVSIAQCRYPELPEAIQPE